MRRSNKQRDLRAGDGDWSSSLKTKEVQRQRFVPDTGSPPPDFDLQDTLAALAKRPLRSKQVLANAKCLELFNRWLFETETDEILNKDLIAVKEGKGEAVLHGIHLGLEFYNKSERTPSRQRSRPPLSPDIHSSLKYKPRTPSASSPRTPPHEISNKAISVPRFYWPEGKPPPTPYLHESICKAEAEFNKLATPLIYEDFGKFLQTIGISLYWKRPFWNALGMNENDKLTFTDFKRFYGPLVSQCPDDSSRFLRILSTASKKLAIESQNNNNSNLSGEHIKAKVKPGNDLSKDSRRNELVMADFVLLVQDIIETHPGLGFLREAPEFHSRYMTTVISRIYYKVNRSWTGRITLSELRRSNLLRVIKRLEEETDVNAITEYFSYEHFYVIYCKFWELDKDHDLLIDKKDLAAHSENALSSRIIDRIFSGTVIRGWDIASPINIPGKMTYSDFVWFLISEEDKKSPTAIEYWFRCLDLDGDGILSPFELQHFYSEQESRIECLGIEPLDFSNVYCQMIDMLRCSAKGVRLKDLKKNPQLAANFFNTLFNLDKYLDHEQRDPFAAAGYTPGTSEFTNEGESDWDKFAAAEYELLIAEESPTDHMHDVSDFEDGVGVSP